MLPDAQLKTPFQSKAPPPFAMTASPNFAELLCQLECTLLLSTFQAGKVILISAINEEKLIQLPRNFERPMGIAVKGDKMAIACHDEVVLLHNSPQLATDYPSKKENQYDAFYTPRASYYTGPLDIHDLHLGAQQHLIGVNTTFSCISRIDHHYSHTPIWQPAFISELTPHDICHLNGLAMQGPDPMYVTALGSGSTAQSWRENLLSGGVLIHIPTGEIVTKGLAMPHSPRLYDNELYLLCSAQEKLVKIEVATGKAIDVCHVPGFVRGMCKIGDHVFIASSKLRKNASIFRDLPIADRAKTAAIYVVHLPTGVVVAQLEYKSSVDEIYDVQVLPQMRRPNILNNLSQQYKQAIVDPHNHYWYTQGITENTSQD